MGAEFTRRHQQQGGSLCSDYSSDGLKRYYRLHGRDATLGAERGWLRVEAPSKVGRHAQHAKGLSGYFGFAFSCGGTGGGQVADSWGGAFTAATTSAFRQHTKDVRQCGRRGGFVD